MRASLLEGDLDLPAQDEPTDDLQGIPRGISAQQRLGREPAKGIAQQDPADGHDGHPAMTPHRRPGTELDLPIPFAIAALPCDPSPERVRVAQYLRRVRQAK